MRIKTKIYKLLFFKKYLYKINLNYEFIAVPGPKSLLFLTFKESGESRTRLNRCK